MPLKGTLAASLTVLGKPWVKQSDCPQNRIHLTDAGLVYLEELTNLERLSLCDTQVTDKGVEKLQQALPNCEISHKPPRRFPDSTDGW